ncbi:signal recognition particle-docking protein FtsY [Tateyamaria pelophila]|uniref:signal recognition particle-docking protein FtsY n=1 Tax=Tateyamaria pelophila TaxID=328415 RepID=UPI001CC029B9|nr:signal recognition particle-docking protein FtsY [Tateyamaria pelophila]
MAFFKKLKDRLFKSSSRIDEGLEAIVEDGGIEAAADPDLVTAPDTAPDPTEESAPKEQPAPAADLEPTPESTPALDPVPEPEPPSEPRSDAAAEPEPELNPEPDTIPIPEPAREREPVHLPSPAPQTPDVDPAPVVVPPSTPDAPTAKETSEKTEPPVAARPKPVAMPTLTDPVAPAETAPAKQGILGRLMGRKDAAPVLRRTLDDDMLEQLEELLIASDMGVDTALRVTANMAEGRMGKKLSVTEIKQLMAGEIARIMEAVAKPLPLYAQKPQVVLVVGVNGSGKTTTIGKLASQFRAGGKSVVIAAGDTFRAAAVEQLQVWGERAGVPVLTAPEGSDPASLAYDAMTKAQEDGADLLMIDTAGRLQNRGDLMEELAKIVRVIRKKDPSAPHNTLLVLDATTGQNALNQVKVFQEVSDVSGLVMTKLDGTAKGGVLVALADKFGLPIHAIGVGEQIDDLSPFDPDDFAAALTGLDRE